MPTRCAEIAEEIGLPALIHAGAEIRTSAGRKRVNFRADAVEALIAALYLDGGMETARAFILRYWEPRAEAVDVMRRDAKTELQEWAHQAVQAHAGLSDRQPRGAGPRSASSPSASVSDRYAAVRRQRPLEARGGADRGRRNVPVARRRVELRKKVVSS